MRIAIAPCDRCEEKCRCWMSCGLLDAIACYVGSSDRVVCEQELK
ncbi:MAG: hypothetical protein AAGA60_03145 [Cyanobacteria bacterium P01_E01_bin.42]